jgi:hypothetical protein
MADAWIWQCKQLLWAQETSKKTETLPSQKSSPKPLGQLTRGVDSANSSCGLRNHQRIAHITCGLRNHQWKLSLCYLWNHQQNWFHGWRVDSSAQPAPVGSEIMKENWDAAESKLVTETTCIADAWSRQGKQLLWAQESSTKTKSLPTHKSSMKCFHG